MLTNRTIKHANRYCKDDITLIENYEEAINSTENYCCHHKKGLKVSHKDLIDQGLYYNRPANELVFMEIGEHQRLHHLNCREETKQKRSDSLKGKNNPMFGKKGNAKQVTIDGVTYCCLKDAYNDIKPKYSYGHFCRQYKKGEL